MQRLLAWSLCLAIMGMGARELASQTHLDCSSSLYHNILHASMFLIRIYIEYIAAESSDEGCSIMESFASVYVCSLCSARSTSLSLWMSHLRQVHSNESSTSIISCPVHDCSAEYGNVHSLISHIYRKHPQRGSTLSSPSSGTTLAVGSSVIEPQNQAVVENSTAEFSLEDFSSEQANTEGEGCSSVYEDFDFCCLERKKKSCLLLMQLKEERMLTQAAINDVVQGCQNVVSYALSSVRSKVNHLSSQFHTEEIEEVKAAITDVFDPFAGLETSYLQETFIRKEMGCIVCSLRLYGYLFTIILYVASY